MNNSAKGEYDLLRSSPGWNPGMVKESVTDTLQEQLNYLPVNYGRIGVFIPALEGGGERVMLDIADGIRRRGAHVDVILAKALPGNPYMDQIRPGIRVLDLNAPGAWARFVGLSRYLASERPDALLTFDDFFNVASLAKRFARVDTVVVTGIHNTISQLFRCEERRKNWLRRFLFRPLLRLSDRIVAVSQGVAADLERSGAVAPGTVSVIYNPVLPELVLRAQIPVAHPFIGPGRPPIVLGIGQLAPRKGFDTLIKAFALVRKQQDARLIILGEGSQRPALEELIRRLDLTECVVLPGLSANPYRYLNVSSVFVLSSRFEGLGMVLIEALALGVPVVATNCPSGPSEILEDGKYGTLVPVDDPEQLAAGILSSLQGPRNPEAAQHIRERFSLDKAADEYLRLIYAKASR